MKHDNGLNSKMSEIALYKIKRDHIDLIERETHYKIKYKDDFTLLRLYLHTIIDCWTQENGFIKLLLKDPQTIQNIDEFDEGVSKILHQNYTPILQKSKNQVYIYIHPNNDNLKYYREKPTHIYLYLKMIRKANYNPKVNRATIYIRK